jgi:hypothetical protein
MRGAIPPRACFANDTSEGDRIEMSGVQIPDFLKKSGISASRRVLIKGKYDHEYCWLHRLRRDL